MKEQIDSAKASSGKNIPMRGYYAYTDNVGLVEHTEANGLCYWIMQDNSVSSLFFVSTRTYLKMFSISASWRLGSCRAVFSHVWRK